MSFEGLIVGQQSEGEFVDLPVAADAVISFRDQVCTNAQGFAVAGADTEGLTCWGSSEQDVDNTGGANAARSVRVWLSVRGACFVYAHTGLTQALVGKPVYVAGPKSVTNVATASNDIVSGILMGLTPNNAVVRHSI
ncbi:MAG: hypothetical protein KF764_03020 [Labilithrix sp.]|nr:hypothetical protein [Labilithrix sp.]